MTMVFLLPDRRRQGRRRRAGVQDEPDPAPDGRIQGQLRQGGGGAGGGLGLGARVDAGVGVGVGVGVGGAVVERTGMPTSLSRISAQDL